MDIEKLIVSLRSPSWQDLEDPDAPLLEDAAHALSTLQARQTESVPIRTICFSIARFRPGAWSR